MWKKYRTSIFYRTRVFIRKIFHTFLVAFMIGISNVINQEDRTILDTRLQIEQKKEQAEEEN